ncbi:hypothetical protein MMC10_000065 [Thelotrema lepadinum]|nr:hypothetical protein [Thelotrema lepadinum]
MDPNHNIMPDESHTSYFTHSTGSGNTPMWRAYDKNVTYLQGKPSSDESVSGGVNVSTRVCQLEFTIPDTIGPPVFLYYRLTNFFQNHRRYVKSFDAGQLSGQNNSALGNCPPLATNDTSGRTVYPCGLIANSIFNDTINSPQGINIPDYTMSNANIAWPSDAKLYGRNSYDLNKIEPPPYWSRRWGTAGYTSENPPPDLSNYWEFQVWMRTAGLPSFSKLALRNDTTAMASGPYRIEIYSGEYSSPSNPLAPGDEICAKSSRVPST